MDRGKWEKTFTQFQACARGYLVRKEVGRAREDFEDVVREIDGDLTHLQWRDTVIPIPHFTDTDEPFLQFATQPSGPGLNASASLQTSAATEAASASLSLGRDGGQAFRPQKIEAEKDDSGMNSPDSHPDVDGDGFRRRDQEEDKDAGMMESTENSTSLWSSLELDVNYSHPNLGPRQYCSAQEVPRTAEALRLHRNTLTMELVWLQQAIESRKKYLSLKDQLTMS